MNFHDLIPTAALMYEGVFDKKGDPIVVHAMRVALRLKEMGEEVQIAALFHDVVEDTPFTADDLAYAGLSEHSIELVKIMTRDKADTYAEYLAKILASKTDAIAIKLADLYDHIDPANCGDFIPASLIAKYMKNIPAFELAAGDKTALIMKFQKEE